MAKKSLEADNKMRSGNLLMTLLKRTPIRTFVIYPLVTLLWEIVLHGRGFTPKLWFAPLRILGFLQYRLCGGCRVKHGGGGPGVEKPPDRLVSSGFYAYCRNPMYLGHIIFLSGLALTLRSWLGMLITIAVAVWFHLRVLSDEKKLLQVLGRPYAEYLTAVTRWIPGVL